MKYRSIFMNFAFAVREKRRKKIVDFQTELTVARE